MTSRDALDRVYSSCAMCTTDLYVHYLYHEKTESQGRAEEFSFWGGRNYESGPKGRLYEPRPEGPRLRGMGSRRRGVPFPWVGKFYIFEPL